MGARNGNRIDLRPYRCASDVEWAWAAGVFEGEGSVHRNCNKGNYLQIRIAQKEPHILHKLRSFTGGNVRQSRVCGSFPSDGGVMWRLELCGGVARQFILKTWKWLSPKRHDQIERVCSLEDIRNNA